MLCIFAMVIVREVVSPAVGMRFSISVDEFLHKT